MSTPPGRTVFLPLVAPFAATFILTTGGCIGALSAHAFARELAGTPADLLAPEALWPLVALALVLLAARAVRRWRGGDAE